VRVFEQQQAGRAFTARNFSRQPVLQAPGGLVFDQAEVLDLTDGHLESLLTTKYTNPGFVKG